MRPVILDVDPGVDDALAILMALHSPELEVVGLTTTSGNVPLDQSTENALKVVELAGRPELPVCMGAARPLAGEPLHAYKVHGPEGLGEAQLPDPEGMPAGDAVDFLIQGIEARLGEVIVVAMGPLTNLALAEARRPGVLRQSRQLVIMGGVLHEPGNVSPLTEFNFHADPLAARQVINSGANIALVPLEAARQLWLDQDLLEARLAGRADPLARFCAEATRSVMAFETQLYGRRGMHLHDPLAVGLSIFPELCQVEPMWLDVEPEGQLTSGQVVVDRRPFVVDDHLVGRPVECAVKVNVPGFLEVFLDRLLL
ncbi:MAG: nucleoside hydrolase [Candidatus Handelsmanbacteria bacterium]|nr:nucleoside hydrolase [Candidatus Handelsmanbacteria bacterium]